MNSRVLHVVNFSFVLPYFIGDQIGYFQDKGYDIYISCIDSEHAREYTLQKKVKFFPVNIQRKISLLSDLQAVIKLIRIIKKENISIVIGHTPKGGLLSMIASYVVGLKTRVYFRHGLMYETSKGINRILFKAIERFTGYLATKVVCVSQSVLDISNKELSRNRSKNILLGKGTCNGINTSYFDKEKISEEDRLSLSNKLGITKEQIVIGYVGRLVKDKGIEELIKGWKILTQKYANICLLLVGPFEERDCISEEMIEYIQSNKTIICTGLVKDSRTYYSLMDIFVLPSYREGFPTVVLEASAMSLPVITTCSTGCIDSIVEHKTGIFSNIDPVDIAEKIGMYIEEPSLRNLHGENGRNFVIENFSQLHVWNEIEKKVL